MTPKRIVHLVDDEESIRKSAGFMLKTSGFAVQTYASGIAFLKAVKTAEPGCILLDVRMPGMDGLEVQEVLAERGVTMPVIVLTGHGDVGIAVRVMKAGAVDFLEKPFEKTALLASIGVAFSRLDKSDARSLREAEARVRVAVLTPREREVLIGLANGFPNKTIAYDLGLSPRTVEVHRANVMTKMEASSLSELVRMAVRAGALADG